MRRSTRILIVAVLAILALARVSALTASNTFAPGATAPYTGYTTTTVTRPALSSTFLSSLRYNLNPSRTSIVSVTLVLKKVNLLSPDPVLVNFNGGSLTECNDGESAGPLSTTYTYTCTGLAQPPSTLASTGVTIR